MLKRTQVPDPGARRAALAFRLGLVIVLLLALVPRLTYPLSRPVNWYNRSIAFWDALLSGDLAGTYRQYHPGVTTMWVAGLGLRVYAASHGLDSSDMYEAQTETSGTHGQPHRAGVAALALIIAGCIGLAYALLTQLVDWPLAFLSGCLLALDPFWLEQSQILHVDALLTSTMLVSALSLLVYLRHRRTQMLVLSGLLAGLALLTKTTAVFLVPFSVTVMAWKGLGEVLSRDTAPSRARRPLLTAAGREVCRIARALALWMVVAGCTYAVLWPAMWVRPLDTLAAVANAVVLHVDTPHVNANFFAGRVLSGDLGPLYYLATLAWKSTLVSLSGMLAAAACLTLGLHRRPATDTGGHLRGDERRGGRSIGTRFRLWSAIPQDRSWPAWCMFLYLAAFVVGMALAKKKGLHYLLPAFPAMDVLAAWGLWQLASILGRRARPGGRARGSALFLGTVVLLELVTVLRHSPHYGTHHNVLLGGSRVAQYILPLGEQGEGLDVAAHFLNQYEFSDRLTVGVQQRGMRVFQRNFEGTTVLIDSANVDYRVFQINPIQRHQYEERWRANWEAAQESQPLWTVSYDGVPYVWIYRAFPHTSDGLDIEQPLNVRLGGQADRAGPITLLGYRLGSSAVSAGDELLVELFWQLDGRLAADHHVFVHLLGDSGELAAQHDGVPHDGARPTWTWRDTEVVEDSHLLDTTDLDPGLYSLHVGMYDFATGERLSVEGAASDTHDSDSVWIGDVTIGLP